MPDPRSPPGGALRLRPDSATALSSKAPVRDERAERLLADALRGRGGTLTQADAVTLTGLPADQTEAALRSLLGRYKSHLAVTDKGELLYRFDAQMVRRDAPTLEERAREAFALAWKGFTVLFKIWIVATLVFYVTAFVAMAIALLFARSGNDWDDRRRDGGFHMPLLFWLMPDWAPRGYYNDPWGAPQRRQLAPTGPRKRFYHATFDYVFGPAAPKEDPLQLERSLLAEARRKAGRLTATDVVALTGWSYQRAEEALTALMVAQDGEPEVQADGTIVYKFSSLRTTAGELTSGPAPLAVWQQPRMLTPLTGNTSQANTVITLMNGFNMFAAVSIGPAFLARYGLGDAPGAELLVTAFPLVFSSIFYAVPAGRAIARSRRKKRQEREAARARVLAEIFSQQGAPILADALRAAAGLPRPQADKILDALLAELDGDVDTDAEGRTRYAFPRIREELAAAAAARALAPAEEASAGQVVFDSGVAGTGELDAALPSGSRLVPGLPDGRPKA